MNLIVPSLVGFGLTALGVSFTRSVLIAFGVGVFTNLKSVVRKITKYLDDNEDLYNKGKHNIKSECEYFSQLQNTFLEFNTLRRTSREYNIATHGNTAKVLLLRSYMGYDIHDDIEFCMNKNDSQVFFDIYYTIANIEDKYLTLYKNSQLDGFTAYSFVAASDAKNFTVAYKNEEVNRLMKLGHEISAKDRQILNYMFLIEYGSTIISHIELIEELNLPKDVKYYLKKKFVNSVFTYLDF